jgi:hypothetical protein
MEEIDRLRIRMLIQEAQKHTDPRDPDPDPEHCYKGTGLWYSFF